MRQRNSPKTQIADGRSKATVREITTGRVFSAALFLRFACTTYRLGAKKLKRKTEVEAVAFVVCCAIGLETGSAVQDYIGLYEGDTKLLTESLEYIQRTATHILNAISADESSAPPT